MPDFLTVAKLGDIPVGEGRAFEYHDQMVAVFNDNGEYRAIDDMCPHMGASLAAGHLEDSVVTCPWHGWSFDTRDGAWCDNRRISIDVFLVRVVGEEIQIAAVEKKPTGKSGEPADRLASPPENKSANSGCEADPHLSREEQSKEEKSKEGKSKEGKSKEGKSKEENE